MGVVLQIVYFPRKCQFQCNGEGVAESPVDVIPSYVISSYEEPLAEAVLGPSGHRELCTRVGKVSTYRPCVYACLCVHTCVTCAHLGLGHMPSWGRAPHSFPLTALTLPHTALWFHPGPPWLPLS